MTDRQEQLYQRIIALSWHHPRYGYRRIRALLAREGWIVSRKQVQRIRRREGLKVRPKISREAFHLGMSCLLSRGFCTQSKFVPTTNRVVCQRSIWNYCQMHLGLQGSIGLRLSPM
ncbi:MAG: transposase [Gemmatimonadetes bacterium]|nr:transposase [Gemmatimonadota bacterium]MBT5327689.1 transposase [Gemmatimonadota bacterium]MBT5449787.1 transposase [Gemmatimonadota bacterium]MBT5803403.1 transposase [Gemmatimonadota bacterium]MBT6622660.1 transposase [Gemmatimonadota bacterium]